MAHIVNKIPEFDIRERAPTGTITHQSRMLDEILGALKFTKDSFFVREQVYGIAQLYTDGLVDNPFQKHMWHEQEGVLRDIHQAGIIATGQFYSGEEVDIEQIINLHLVELNEQLQKAQKISIKAETAALKALSKSAYNIDTGARNVEKTVQDLIQELVIGVLKNKKHKINYELLNKENKFVLS